MSTQFFGALWPRRVLRGAGGFHTYYDRNGYNWKIPPVIEKGTLLLYRDDTKGKKDEICAHTQAASGYIQSAVLLMTENASIFVINDF